MKKLIVTMMVLTLASFSAYAQNKGKKLKLPSDSAQPSGKTAAPPAGTAPAKKPDGKLDVSELEDKYWAPKDTDFNVVQNRTYSKEKRFSLTGLFGTPTNDLFNEGSHLGLVANYYFSERYGVELNYIISNLTDNATVTKFEELSEGGGTSPDYSRLKSQIGAAFNWIPFYAKMSFLNQKIIYFDMGFSPAISMLTYEQQTDGDPSAKTATSVALGFDITQQFFFSKHFAVRVDLRNRWYREETIGYRTGSSQGDKASTLTMLLLGGTFFF